MTPPPADDPAAVAARVRRVIEQLCKDRDAFRDFNSAKSGGETRPDWLEAEARYTAAIDAAQRALDTLMSAAGRVAASGTSSDAASTEKHDNGTREPPATHR